MTKFFLRTKQLWDDYKPDMIYFDDSVLPFWGVTDEVGLKLAAHFYNSSIQMHGHNEAVMNNKMLNEMQRRTMVYDIERGKAAGIMPQPWQTDTCIGSWHYNQDIFKKHKYKSAASVVRMLADIVSKNGNLMLSVPLQRDGTPDADEMKIVSEIGSWLKVNGEAIYATRPWKVYGEGPSVAAAVETNRFGGVKDVGSKPFTAEDIRFTQSKDGKTIYAICLDVPKQAIKLKSVTTGKIASVSLIGSDAKLDWKQEADALVIQPVANWPCQHAVAFKIDVR
jgi:alpha-L-fucosidase